MTSHNSPNEAGPSTPQPIRRTLHTHPTVHIYAVPPIRPGTKGYTSRTWTAQAPIFTARLEIVEITSVIPTMSHASTNPHLSELEADANTTTTTISIRLSDPQTGELFAAAPYTHPATVTPCIDSGRFFALRVADESGRKATLGVGFEEREGAFEFLEGLGRAGKILGFNSEKGGERGVAGGLRGPEGGVGMGRIVRDVSGKGSGIGGEKDASALFAIAPPPPPPANDAPDGHRAGDDGGSERRDQKTTNDEPPDNEVDDDDFGEFQ